MVTFCISLIALVLGYLLYGRFVDSVFGPDDRETPLLLMVGTVFVFSPATILQGYGGTALMWIRASALQSSSFRNSPSICWRVSPISLAAYVW